MIFFCTWGRLEPAFGGNRCRVFSGWSVQPQGLVRWHLARLIQCTPARDWTDTLTGQTPNSVSPSLMPSSLLGSFVPQVFVVSSEFDVFSPMAAWVAENNPDDFLDDGLCLNLVGKNDTILVFSGSLDSCLVWFAGMKVLHLRSSYKLPPSGVLCICSRDSLSVQDDGYGSYMGTFSAPDAQHIGGFVGHVQHVSRSDKCVGCEVYQGSSKPYRIGSRVEAFHEGKLCRCLHTWSVPRIRDALQGVHCRYRHSSSCVEARHLSGLPPLWVFCRFLLCVLSWLFPWDPGLSACSGTSIAEGSTSLMLPSRCVLLLFKCIGEHVEGLATTTSHKSPSYAAAATATPRVDVEKGPQAAADA